MNDQIGKVTADVKVPQSKDFDGPFKVEEIPLPPPELWAELDNSGAPEADAQTSAAPVVETPEPVREIAQLDFVDPIMRLVPLDFPFRWDGQIVEKPRSSPVRRPGRSVPERPSNGFSSFDVYAAMTGYPAAVLRGLIAEDSEKVTDAALDFFRPPRSGGRSICRRAEELASLCSPCLPFPPYAVFGSEGHVVGRAAFELPRSTGHLA